ncbi:uncharacterized protein LOC135176404 [Pogoniulus pusillus]|uniref:uncharacterized protein LOC135176404 n=1 Tax=Pogoniulus pusillus TaxID=488313 RepID=UPI0030B962E0
MTLWPLKKHTHVYSRSLVGVLAVLAARIVPFLVSYSSECKRGTRCHSEGPGQAGEVVSDEAHEVQQGHLSIYRFTLANESSRDRSAPIRVDGALRSLSPLHHEPDRTHFRSDQAPHLLPAPSSCPNLARQYPAAGQSRAPTKWYTAEPARGQRALHGGTRSRQFSGSQRHIPDGASLRQRLAERRRVLWLRERERGRGPLRRSGGRDPRAAATGTDCFHLGAGLPAGEDLSTAEILGGLGTEEAGGCLASLRGPDQDMVPEPEDETEEADTGQPAQPRISYSVLQLSSGNRTSFVSRWSSLLLCSTAPGTCAFYPDACSAVQLRLSQIRCIAKHLSVYGK